MPPLLAGAMAAQAWIEDGLSNRALPAHALARGLRPAGPAAAGARLVRSGAGFGDRKRPADAARRGGRSARRLGAPGQSPPCT